MVLVMNKPQKVSLLWIASRSLELYTKYLGPSILLCHSTNFKDTVVLIKYLILSVQSQTEYATRTPTIFLQFLFLNMAKGPICAFLTTSRSSALFCFGFN